ncbi:MULTISPECIES: DNA-binding protein [unclassified Streptomyces]|uniref:DNA-binding protein n=1 Tax=unclassified Streptomyces TaxID=2593676 RepID=UPI00088071BE|nr:MULTISPECIES: DNA-binding protein [unclassified Streptomyces]PBC84470.1 transcriptional regulator with XRE-family HTH domain [Streptomyces sp. 2321.6]SDR30345.1 Transcriptional regulator, contains XRE-family HTH domain [Streptomyces sp. KS_16]SED32535.1 Transcriptional regulator, contains XRE-family HTH domain [Streptomyces sp. 2133.1]SEE51337.1 Transcriptional regulator, contains XRE-family HTH domain [Streptomyces sp. 2112.3]SNC70553.1 Transcriptional regulator, contains XRE-family HTH do
MGDFDAGLWSHPRLAAALLDEDWGAVFRTYRRLAGISQMRLGELVGLVQPDVSEIERGRRRVTSVEVRQRIIAGLGIARERLSAAAPGVEALPVPGLAFSGTAPDEDLLSRVTNAVDGSHRVDTATLDWLDRLLAEHRRAEDFIGSRPLVAVMSQQLRTVVDLYAGARGPLAERVVRLAAEHAQFLAWMAQDQGQSAAALAWYDRSHEWALEAGDSDMAATTLSMKAHMAWSGGRGNRCVRLAEAARWSAPHTSLGVQGMAAQMEARGHALSHAPDEAHRLLDDAQDLIGRAAQRPEDEPPWMYFYDETWFTLQRGMAAMHLGDWPGATRHITTGLDALPTGYRRDRAWYLSCLAHAHAAAGETEQALAAALLSVPDAADIGRPHAWNELHTTASVLLRRRVPEGRRLTDALREHD